MSPSPFRWHQRVVFHVLQELDRFVRERELGETGMEVDALIDPVEDVVYRPDVYFIARERLPLLTDEGHLVVAPDLVVEVASERSRRFDRRTKRADYERNQSIKEYWLLDIVEEPPAAYVWHRQRSKLKGGKVRGDRLRSRLLKGFELDLKTVWARAMEGRS